MILYRAARALVRVVNKLFFFVRVEGSKKLPEGPVIICPNHISFIDAGAIAASVDRKLTALAKESLFKKPFLGWLFRNFRLIPVKRASGAGDFAAVRAAVDALKNGCAMMIFPQGTRCPGEFPNDSKVRGGVAMIAAKTDALIVPVFVGTKYFRVRPFRRLTLRFGEPFKVSELYDGRNDKNFLGLSKLVFQRVTDLAPENLTEAKK